MDTNRLWELNRQQDLWFIVSMKGDLGNCIYVPKDWGDECSIAAGHQSGPDNPRDPAIYAYAPLYDYPNSPVATMWVPMGRLLEMLYSDREAALAAHPAMQEHLDQLAAEAIGTPPVGLVRRSIRERQVYRLLECTRMQAALLDQIRSGQLLRNNPKPTGAHDTFQLEWPQGRFVQTFCSYVPRWLVTPLLRRKTLLANDYGGYDINYVDIGGEFGAAAGGDIGSQPIGSIGAAPPQ